MFHLEDVVQLKDNEDVRLLVRRHFMTLVPGLLLALILIVVPFFFLFPLFSLGTIGIIIFGALVLAGILVAVRTVITWDADVLIVTTLRLVDVDQRGVWSRFVTEVFIDDVLDIRWHRKGILYTLCNVGFVEIQAGTLEHPLHITRIGHPQRLQELVNDLRKSTRPKHHESSPERQERMRKIQEVLSSLSNEAFERVEKTVKHEVRQAAMGSFLEKDTSA